ncbi:MAG: hypothetical protein ACI89J_003872 [Hyphomicrobiaceae bacterium]|jgi:hypothetical protein
MSTEVEKIVYGAMDSTKSMRLSVRFETAHTPLPNSSRLMGKLRSIVRIARGVRYGLRYQLPMSHTAY